MRYKYYYQKIVRPLLLSNCLYTNIFQIPNLQKITLSFGFLNDNIDDDANLILSMLLLESIANLHPYVRNCKSIYRSKTKNLIFVIVLTLRKMPMFNFMDVFVTSAIPFFGIRYVVANKSIDLKASTYSLMLRDMNVFFNIPENYYKWNFDLMVNITFNSLQTMKPIYFQKLGSNDSAQLVTFFGFDQFVEPVTEEEEVIENILIN